MSSSEIAAKLKPIISCLQDIGLNIIAVIYDQATSNCVAINMLKKERRGEEISRLGFFIGGQEIVPLFDPPHLLKGEYM